MTFKKSSIKLSDTGQFSKLILDYINGNKSLRSFYSYEPTIESFKQAIEDKNKERINRSVLVDVLQEQYLQTGINNRQSLINNLLIENTYTVCTGHQLCLFTGPLYFIFKIITTINLAEKLKVHYPQSDFIPVYWMASEDHDFAEISSINLFGKKITWNKTDAKGAVGHLSTESLSVVIDELKAIMGESDNAKTLIELFTDSYLKHNNLADATRYLVDRLFADYNLLVLDADDGRLKNEFMDLIRDDIKNNTNFKLINTSIEALKKQGYDAQVNPREINVFQLSDNDRVRIEKATEETLNLKPEIYSPNVVLRPLYQQKILPNLAYVGGPGEIAYWLEYKSMFDHHQIKFPVLIPRNFAMITDEKANQQLTKLGFTVNDLFKDSDSLIKEFVNRNAGSELSLKEEEEKLKLIYSEIAAKAVAVDGTLKNTVEAEMQKSINALKNIESKLLRSEKQKQETSINQIKKLKDKFFPEGTLQERFDNVAPYYLKSGKQLIIDLKGQFNPFEFEMMILE